MTMSVAGHPVSAKKGIDIDWDYFIGRAREYCRSEKALHWYAKRAEEFLQVMDGIPCADLTEEALRQFFEKLGRDHLLADWQFRQYVNAICCLMHTLRHPLAIDFDWAYWRHSSRALSASHPTLLREQIVESLHAPQKSINPPVSKAQPIRRETISTPVNFERRDQPIEQRTRSASNSAEWVRNDSSPCPVGPLPHDAHIAAVVREIRRQGLSIRTEQAYSKWIVRLLRHVNEAGGSGGSPRTGTVSPNSSHH